MSKLTRALIKTTLKGSMALSLFISIVLLGMWLCSAYPITMFCTMLIVAFTMLSFIIGWYIENR